MRVGVEVGGTFTDLVAVEGGRVVVTKVPSTPRSPDIGAFAALAASGVDLARIEDLGHGSTVATNAVLERKGAAVAFVSTAGFRDLLFMQRHDRRNIYDLFYAKPAPPVRRKDCFEAVERLGADGSVERPLDEARVRAELIPALKQGGYRAVAICLLNAYANPVHERRLAELIAATLPDLLVTCSHRVAREFREFERASTTLLSAYVQPVIDGYLHRFESKLARSGFKGRFTVMQSNGGRLPAEAMRESAITALYSGPAAGVVGATRQAARSGFHDLITFDMGGTSTDVCLVQEGRPSLASESEIDGLPIRTPVLDIVSVGAGGGSIAWVDDGGMLRVGPQSAGADPGPACYGKGGPSPTTTDAHIVIGTIRPGAFLGGRMNLDGAAARHAFEPLAARFGLGVEQAASQALQLADANIVRAIQLVSTERGRDPRDYALVPFGGAGPLHGARIAEELGIATIVVPPNAGVISAYGLVASDYTKFDAVTRKMKLDDAAAAEAGRLLGEMRARLAQQFADMKLPGDLLYTHTLDMRFVGQAFEVGVELQATRLDSLDAAYLAESFADAHHRTFMHGANLDRPVEIVTLRVGATLPIGTPPRLDRETQAGAAPGKTRVFHGEDWIDCSRYAADALTTNRRIVGPAVIEGYTATTWVPPGWTASLDQADNLILRRAS
jgi:N-methylhydantoinase A